ncbi:T9SS type A sorting domain-containing protein [Flavobacterium sp. N1994]|uniref:T9SS type A sorting domain-containing protein n=1 Tax=Flavobacterium sp. N1994 TaxID=2986827 RepID=UPI00222206D7|nr:T9SS type A sorting domain-containing protein [Flavobacterium sp. N1994]
MNNAIFQTGYCNRKIFYGFFILLFLFNTNSVSALNYYIDSVNGNDNNNGTSITTPWKNISKVNTLTLISGSQILLKCNSVWNGQQLKFLGSGNSLSPIIIDQYGTGAKPVINGNGLTTVNQGVVYLYNQDYIEINNIEITNYPTLLAYAIKTAYSLNQIVYYGTNAYLVTVAGTSATTGGYPKVTSGSTTSGGVTFTFYCKLTSSSYPNNLFFTGISDGTLNNNPLGADRRGVMVAVKDKGLCSHVYLKNLNIHHVKGQLGSGSSTINGAIPKRTGGIYFTVLNESSTSNSRFDDVLINNCSISYSENIGIAFDNEDNVYYPGGQNSSITADVTEYNNWYARRFSNVHISNNAIHHIGKNALILRCTDETGLVDHNVCYETALGTTGNTMFTARAKGTIFQYNEGYYNRATTQSVDPGSIDGSMYDADFGSVGIIFQYSYSHDNSQGIYWGCNTRGSDNNTTGIPDPGDVGCTLRYSISQNDKGKLVFFNYSSAGNEIYNNVFYIKSGLSPTIISENSGNNHTYNYNNNIIYNSGSGSYNFATVGQTRSILNNVYYGNHPSSEPSSAIDTFKITSNPLFVSAGTGTNGLTSLNGYKLKSTSPVISNGKVISTNGGFDFYGYTVSNSLPPNRGAYEGTGVIKRESSNTIVNPNPVDDAIKVICYPNPVEGILTISNINAVSDIVIYNVMGQIVYENKTSDESLQIDMSKLERSTYLVQIISEGKKEIVKIIKK